MSHHHRDMGASPSEAVCRQWTQSGVFHRTGSLHNVLRIPPVLGCSGHDGCTLRIAKLHPPHLIKDTKLHSALWKCQMASEASTNFSWQHCLHDNFHSLSTSMLLRSHWHGCTWLFWVRIRPHTRQRSWGSGTATMAIAILLRPRGKLAKIAPKWLPHHSEAVSKKN